jgi:hypothetical protein
MTLERLVLLGIAGALAAGVAWQWPEIERYLKVRSM